MHNISRRDYFAWLAMEWIYSKLKGKLKMKFLKTFTQKPAIIVEPRTSGFALADFYSVPEGKRIGYCHYDVDWHLDVFIDNCTAHPVSGRYYSRIAMKKAIGNYFRFEGDTSAKIDSLLPR